MAGAYEGAVRLLGDSGFPGRLHFIAHAGRDICDRLIYVLDPQDQPSRVQYESQLDRLVNLWSFDLGAFSGDGKPVKETVEVQYPVAAILDSLITAHRSRRQRPNQYVLLFQYLTRNEPLAAEVNTRLVSDFKAVREWFMHYAHLGTETPVVDEHELQRTFEAFEGMLHSFVGRFFTATAELDDILQRANQ